MYAQLWRGMNLVQDKTEERTWAMMLINYLHQVWGSFCALIVAVVMAMLVIGIMVVHVLKHNEEARITAKRIARAAALKAARRWFK